MNKRYEYCIYNIKTGKCQCSIVFSHITLNVAHLSMQPPAPGLGDAEEDGGAAHSADDEAAEGADGDGLVGVVGQRP